jgi:glucose uptake protein GlcU
MVLCQSAFQAGPLAESLPLLTAVDPVVSIMIGVLAFHETVGHEPGRVALEVIGTAVMIVGVLLLGRSPLVLLEDPTERSSADAVQSS